MAVQFLLRRFAQIGAAVCAMVLLTGIAQAIDLLQDLSAAQFKAASLDTLASAELDELQHLIDATPAKPSAAARGAVLSRAATRTSTAASEHSPGWRLAAAESARKMIETELTVKHVQ